MSEQIIIDMLQSFASDFGNVGGKNCLKTTAINSNNCTKRLGATTQSYLNLV